MRPGTIDGLVREQARQRPAAEAFVSPGRRPLTLGRLADEVDAAAARLAELGLGRSDRVAVALPQDADAAVALLGVSAVSIAAPLPLDLPLAEAGARLAALGARALLTADGEEGSLTTIARGAGLPILRLTPRPDDVAGAFGLDGDRVAEPAPRRAPQAGDVAAILHTSGTTARPKRVPLTHGALAHGALCGSASLRLAPGDRSLWFAPLHHIGGLLGAVLYPVACGASTALLPGFDADRFFDWLEALEPTWYWGVPAMHQAVLEKAATRRDAARRARLRLVRSGAAPLAPAVIARLQDTFGAAVLEVYGMTETGLLTSNPLPPLPQKAGSVGVPVGAELVVVDEAGRPLPAGIEGEVVARGPGVMQGYDADPEASREAFRDGWLRTGDLGRLDAEGYLTLTGRLKEQINRGGIKVSPRAVDDALLAHPAVAQAAAFPLPHARLGEDLAAAVVLRRDQAAAPGELRAFLAGRLAPAQVPGRIVVLDSIPAGPTGKPRRGELAARLGMLDAPVASLATPDPGGVEAEMCRLWAEVLERPAVGPDDDFFDLGGDSVTGVRLMTRLADVMGARLPASALLEASTPSSLLLLARVRGGARQPSLVPLCGNAALPPFVFCVGFAPLLQLQRLARRLAGGYRVYALFADALQGEPPADRVETFAERGLAALRGGAPAGPYHLAGFCFGAVVAFEIARRLEGAGEAAPLLALFDPPVVPPRFRHRVVDRARASVAGALGRHVLPGEPLRRALAHYRPGRYAGRSFLFLTAECPPDGGDASASAWGRVLGDTQVQRLELPHARLFADGALGGLVDRLAAG